MRRSRFLFRLKELVPGEGDSDFRGCPPAGCKKSANYLQPEKMITVTGISTRRTSQQAASGNAAPAWPAVAGGVIWILATLQYGIVQAIVAGAWHHPPYSWLNNYISDLGNTVCGQFAVPHGTATYVCSPMHSTMNASFVVAGLLTIAGGILLRRFWPQGRLATAALVLWVITGLGKVLVGLSPENKNVDLHLLGTLNIPVGCIAILLLSMSVRQINRTVSIAGILLAILGLAGTVLSTAGQFGGSSLYLGLGVGGMERVSDYPASLWVLMIGIIAVLSAGTLVRQPTSRK
jgi:hypothetical membrane protein